jgi:hypothetical protein
MVAFLYGVWAKEAFIRQITKPWPVIWMLAETMQHKSYYSKIISVALLLSVVGSQNSQLFVRCQSGGQFPPTFFWSRLRAPSVVYIRSLHSIRSCYAVNSFSVQSSEFRELFCLVLLLARFQQWASLLAVALPLKASPF